MIVLLVSLIGASVDAGFKAVGATDRAFSLLPPYRLGRALVLDTLLGPVEDFEYARTTAPSSPPPPIS